MPSLFTVYQKQELEAFFTIFFDGEVKLKTD